MQVQPYLFFEGRCDEAIAFYREAVGAEVKMLMRFKDAPAPGPDATAAAPCDAAVTGDKVMHASLRIGETEILASDGRCQGAPDFRGFGLTLTVADDATAARRFGALAEGGQVTMKLGKTFFASSFGMVADKFGVTWIVIAPAEG